MKSRLSDSIDAYEKFRRSQRLAETTLRGDRMILVPFLTHVGNIWTDNVAEHHVSDFLANRSDKRPAAASLALDHTRLNSFFKWARSTKRMSASNDPMAGRKAPQIPERERSRVHVSKFPYILDVAGQRDPRDRAVIALLLYSLARVGEVEALRIGNVDLADGTIRMRVFKSKKEDRIPITKELDTELRRWFTVYGERCGNLDPSWYLVPARKLVLGDGVLMRDAVTELAPTHRITHVTRTIVKPALAGIGFTVDDRKDLKGEGAHTLRRSGARALFDILSANGYDYALRVVQSLLHHKNLSQTEHYIGITADRKERDRLLKGQAVFTSGEGVFELRKVGESA